jgi:tRNA(Ile)-lysidine synthase TilS/MesJ
MPKPVQTKLHKKVRKLILNAISTFDMIQPKDKVLI